MYQIQSAKNLPQLIKAGMSKYLKPQDHHYTPNKYERRKTYKIRPSSKQKKEILRQNSIKSSLSPIRRIKEGQDRISPYYQSSINSKDTKDNKFRITPKDVQSCEKKIDHLIFINKFTKRSQTVNRNRQRKQRYQQLKLKFNQRRNTSQNNSKFLVHVSSDEKYNQRGIFLKSLINKKFFKYKYSGQIAKKTKNICFGRKATIINVQRNIQREVKKIQKFQQQLLQKKLAKSIRRIKKKKKKQQNRKKKLRIRRYQRQLMKEESVKAEEEDPWPPVESSSEEEYYYEEEVEEEVKVYKPPQPVPIQVTYIPEPQEEVENDKNVENVKPKKKKVFTLWGKVKLHTYEYQVTRHIMQKIQNKTLWTNYTNQ